MGFYWGNKNDSKYYLLLIVFACTARGENLEMGSFDQHFLIGRSAKVTISQRQENKAEDGDELMEEGREGGMW